jgi:tetratricopeptide (TPR) repeat protein
LRSRSLVAAGLVSPERGPGKRLLFSFQDLIVLRTAQALAAAKVPQRRITKSVKELRRRLPDAMPLSGLSIGAIADRVVVREGRRRWQADSGQYLLGFEGDPADGSLNVIERPKRTARGETSDWFAAALGLEREDPEAARRAYERVIAADPERLDARLNLGRLLHGMGRHARSERVYRDALKSGAHDPVLFFNLGALLDDMGRKLESIEAYEQALRADPAMADCHYNLALVCEQLGRSRKAIRHMAQYRRLTGS